MVSPVGSVATLAIGQMEAQMTEDDFVRRLSEIAFGQQDATSEEDRMEWQCHADDLLQEFVEEAGYTRLAAANRRIRRIYPTRSLGR
jgi:hypothetical protein